MKKLEKTNKKGVLAWIDARFPLSKMMREHVTEYYVPKNINWLYFFGSIGIFILVSQILTGVWLTMFYKPSTKEGFDSIEFIMRDVSYGAILRNMHVVGASAFFIVGYLHMFRGLIYGSFKKPRELLWLSGMAIFLMLMTEAFLGYMLPWGQMSFWGASVVISLFDSIPVVGAWLIEFIQGDYNVSDATLNRFFSLHVSLIPLLLVGLVGAHIIALHEVGSNNPDGIEIKNFKDENGVPKDGIPFHPYVTIKDSIGLGVFLIIFFAIVFYAPEMNGYFLEAPNFIPANPLVTPNHVAPLWYFGPFYSILRSSTEAIFPYLGILLIASSILGVVYAKIAFKKIVAVLLGIFGLIILISAFKGLITAKLLGVILMFAAVKILFILPWLDTSPVKSIRFRGVSYKIATILFVISFLALGFLGGKAVTPVYLFFTQLFTLYYFAYFLLILPALPLFEKTKPVPERIEK